MSYFKTIKNALSSSIEAYGRRKTLNYLNTLSDRTLDDLGFSRALLSQGVEGWPWRAEAISNTTSNAQDASAIEAAIKELTAYNDAELADLGISRGELREAVMNGRAGIDNNQAA